MYEMIVQRLLEWVKERNTEITGLTIDTDLAESGAVDSMGFVGLMALLEELGGKNLDTILMNPENFRTIRSIVDNCFQH